MRPVRGYLLGELVVVRPQTEQIPWDESQAALPPPRRPVHARHQPLQLPHQGGLQPGHVAPGHRWGRGRRGVLGAWTPGGRKNQMCYMIDLS